MANPDHLEAALRLYRGHTTHERFAKVSHRFTYKLFLIDIDIDRMDEADTSCALFSVNRFNLFSFSSNDHGQRDGSSLRDWADAMFRDAGINLGGGMIRLVTLARHLFYKFAPISLWYGYSPDGALRGIIYEVNNTFGDHHSYVAHVSSDKAQHVADKALYVSPFFDVSGQYKFTLRAPTDRLSLTIENMLEGDRLHIATIKARAVKATSGAFLRTSLARPFSSLGVSMAIHYQALKLWIKGAGYRSNPGPPQTPASLAVHPQNVPSGAELSPRKRRHT